MDGTSHVCGFQLKLFTTLLKIGSNIFLYSFDYSTVTDSLYYLQRSLINSLNIIASSLLENSTTLIFELNQWKVGLILCAIVLHRSLLTDIKVVWVSLLTYNHFHLILCHNLMFLLFLVQVWLMSLSFVGGGGLYCFQIYLLRPIYLIDWHDFDHLMMIFLFRLQS